MEKTQDLRFRKTKDSIQSAFYSLLLEKDYSSITVKEVSERANINRKTFYLHYNTLEDLLKESLENFYNSYTVSLNAAGFSFSIEKFFLEPKRTDYTGIFSYSLKEMENQKKLVVKLMSNAYCSHLLNIYKIGLLRDLQACSYSRFQLNHKILDLYIADMFYGFTDLFMEWITSPDPVSAEEFAKIVKTSFTGTLELIRTQEQANSPSAI